MVDTEAAFWMKTPLRISEGKDIKAVLKRSRQICQLIAFFSLFSHFVRLNLYLAKPNRFTTNTMKRRLVGRYLVHEVTLGSFCGWWLGSGGGVMPDCQAWELFFPRNLAQFTVELCGTG